MRKIHGRIFWLASWSLILAATGCSATTTDHESGVIARLPPVAYSMPRELAKTVLPAYVIEPPDILSIETVHAVPRAPYGLKVLDVLSIRCLGSLPEAPIGGVYPIEPGGGVNLGVPYGSVRVMGLTVEQAEKDIHAHLKRFLKEPQVAVALAELGASQRVVGQYLVGPDGTVTLGSYGNVSVVGRSVEEAKSAIEQHLSRYLENPVVSLNVFAFNSKTYYVILQGAGLGDAVYRFPVTGNETVLDAISQINGLEAVSSKRIWIARPNECGELQTLPVDWLAVTQCGDPHSNYQLLPGDRLFVSEDKLVAFDNKLAKVIAPFERVMGFSLLGVGTATRFSGPVLRGGGNPNGGF